MKNKTSKVTRRPLTETTAILFEAALDVEADTLMRIQLKYNMQIAWKNKELLRRFRNIRKIAAIF